MDKQSFSLIDKLPNSIEVEKFLLGYIIVDGNAFKLVRESLTGYDFALPQHQKLFLDMDAIYAKYKTLDKTILLDYLKENRDIDKIGGETYIVELLEPEIPESFKESIDVYIRMIKEKSMMRKVQEKCVSILDKCRQFNTYSLEDLEKEIFELRSIPMSASKNIFHDFGETCRGTILKLMETPELPIQTGFRDLDAVIHGLYRKQLTVLAADTSMGKTSLAKDIWLNSAVSGHRGAYLTLEMTKEEMSIRAIQAMTGFPFGKIREMRVTSEEFQAISEAVEHYEKLKCLIADENVSIHDIKKTTRKLKEEFGIELLIVDHLHFITSYSKHETRAMEVGHYTQELKFLAKELDISVLLLAQINRSISKQMDHRPDLKDLKESGSIEQHADNVLFIYRDWIYNKEADPNLAEIIIAKNRNGARYVPTFLRFEGNIMSFKNREEPQQESYYGE